MVVKGGYGVYYDSLNATAITPNQLGFSTVTTVPSSNDFGQTWVSGNPRAGISPLVDPFPVRADGTRFVTPVGTSLGGNFVAGQVLSYGNLDREHARLQRWRAGVQKELGRNMAIEVAYVGTYSDNVDVNSFVGTTTNTNNPASIRQDVLPTQYWNHTDTRNAALATSNNQNVANPFFIGNLTALRTSNPALYNQLAAQALFTSPTIQKNRLLRPFPHMSVGNGLAGPGAAARQGSHARRGSGVPAPVFAGSQPQRGVLGHPRRGVAERHQRVRRSTDAVGDEPECAAASRDAQRRVRAAVRPRPARSSTTAASGARSWAGGRRARRSNGSLDRCCSSATCSSTATSTTSRSRIRRSMSGSTSTRASSAARRGSRQTSRSGCSRCASTGFAATRRLLLNSSISRSFPLMGRSTLQIRLDAANMLNRQHFANPQLNPDGDRFRPRDGECEHGAALPDSDVEADVLMSVQPASPAPQRLGVETCR